MLDRRSNDIFASRHIREVVTPTRAGEIFLSPQGYDVRAFGAVLYRNRERIMMMGRAFQVESIHADLHEGFNPKSLQGLEARDLSHLDGVVSVPVDLGYPVVGKDLLSQWPLVHPFTKEKGNVLFTDRALLSALAGKNGGIKLFQSGDSKEVSLVIEKQLEEERYGLAFSFSPDQSPLGNSNWSSLDGFKLFVNNVLNRAKEIPGQHVDELDKIETALASGKIKLVPDGYSEILRALVLAHYFMPNLSGNDSLFNALKQGLDRKLKLWPLGDSTAKRSEVAQKIVENALQDPTNEEPAKSRRLRSPYLRSLRVTMGQGIDFNSVTAYSNNPQGITEYVVMLEHTLENTGSLEEFRDLRILIDELRRVSDRAKLDPQVRSTEGFDYTLDLMDQTYRRRMGVRT